jgi:hypothetical protein
VGWYEKFKNNFHLSHRELDAVALGAGEWDTEYASVCNAALPFDRCAAHLGDDGWGKAGCSFGDLQMRVYDLKEAPEDLAPVIEARGTADVKRLSGRMPEVHRNGAGPWRRLTLSFEVWYGDYGGTANVDFRLRRLGERTLVVVFMYANPELEKTMEAILKSFEPGRK